MRKEMFIGLRLNSIKSRIIIAITLISLVISALIGGISIINSRDYITKEAKGRLLATAKSESNRIDTIIKLIEKSTDDMGSFVSATFNLSNIRNRSYLTGYQSSLEPIVKKIGEKTESNMSDYVYFIVKNTGGVYGAWYADGEGNGNFTKQELGAADEFIPGPDMGWYFDPINSGKGLWGDPYYDSDLKINMITYSTPVYKDNNLIAVAGMDISFENLKKIVNDIKLYNTGKAFLVNKNYNILVSKDLPTGKNLADIKKGYYKELIELTKVKDYDVIEKDGYLIAFSHLANGFILFATVPASEASGQLLIILTIITVVIILLAGGVAFILGNLIANPIEKLTKTSLQLADNDFTVTIPNDNSETEIGELNRAFKKFVENLRNLIKQINTSANIITENSHEVSTASNQTSQGAKQVSNTVSQLARGSQEQTSNVNSSLENIKVINNAIQNISDNALNAVKISGSTEENAAVGQDKAGKAVDKINQLKNSSDEVSEMINELGRLSSEIGSIVDLIESIAKQTNLLALNAAIEAARAGEHGKGFSVVADEVKKLADQSADATSKVTGMIKEIQSKIGNAVITMGENSSEVKNSVTIIEDVKLALENILMGTKETSNNISKISEEVNNLGENSNNVVKMIENISTISEEMTASSEEVSAITEEQTVSLEEINTSAQKLAEIAEELQKQVSIFKT